jgi:hypothetical protein
MSNDWIEWKGGECPVAPGTRVEVRFRSGDSDPHCNAAWWGWKWMGRDLEDTYDIVAYRVVSEAPKPDMVNSPPHYTDGGIEAIDYIEAKLGPDGFRSYCIGNALKYVSRAGKKADLKQDLSKAIWYLRRAGGE